MHFSPPKEIFCPFVPMMERRRRRSERMRERDKVWRRGSQHQFLARSVAFSKFLFFPRAILSPSLLRSKLGNEAAHEIGAQSPPESEDELSLLFRLSALFGEKKGNLWGEKDKQKEASHPLRSTFHLSLSTSHPPNSAIAESNRTDLVKGIKKCD